MKMKIRYIIALLLFFPLVLFKALSTENLDMKDSLRRLYEKSDSDRIWMKAAEEALETENSNDQTIAFAEELYNRARKEGDKHYMQVACHYLIKYNYELCYTTETAKWFGRLRTLVEESGNWNELYKQWHYVARAYAYIMDYQRALEEARTMLSHAEKQDNIAGIFWSDISMGIIYTEIERLETAIEWLEKAGSLHTQIEDPSATLAYLESLAIAYIRQEKYSKGRTTLNAMGNYMDSLWTAQKVTQDVCDNNRFFISSMFAFTFLKQQNMKYAFSCLNVASSYATPQRSQWNKAVYYETRSLYYRAIGDYKQMLICNDSVMMNITGSLKNRLRYTIQRADALKFSNDLNSAYNIYSTQSQRLDSVSAVMYAQQLTQIRHNYDAKRTMLERNKYKVYTGITISVLLTLCLSFIGWMFWKIKQTELRLKEANAEKEAALKTVEEINEAKSRFLRNMSYSVRSPLNTVMGFSQMLANSEERDSLDEETRTEIAHMVKANTSHLMELVNNVLDLSRLESGMMKFVMSDSDMRQICLDAISMARMREENKAIVTFDDQAGSQMVHTDEGRLIVILSSMLQDFDSIDRRLIIMTLRKDEIRNEMIVEIENTPFGTSDDDHLLPFIQREVARLFIEHFGGSFRVADGTVRFTYPYICD